MPGCVNSAPWPLYSGSRGCLVAWLFVRMIRSNNCRLTSFPLQLETFGVSRQFDIALAFDRLALFGTCTATAPSQ